MRVAEAELDERELLARHDERLGKALLVEQHRARPREPLGLELERPRHRLERGSCVVVPSRAVLIALGLEADEVHELNHVRGPRSPAHGPASR